MSAEICETSDGKFEVIRQHTYITGLDRLKVSEDLTIRLGQKWKLPCSDYLFDVDRIESVNDSYIIRFYMIYTDGACSWACYEDEVLDGFRDKSFVLVKDIYNKKLDMLN